jgi:hypothetical protein
MTEEITPVPGSAEVLALIALITDPQAAKAHVLAIVAERAKADKRLAAADKANADLAAREAEVGKREVAVAAREAEVEDRKAAVNELYAQIDAYRDAAQRAIDAQRTTLAHQMMAFAGLTQHPLQSAPTPESMEPLLYGGKQDAHFGDGVEAPTFQVAVEHAPIGSTLTRSARRSSRGADV